jgi:hypothetical protein
VWQVGDLPISISRVVEPILTIANKRDFMYILLFYDMHISLRHYNTVQHMKHRTYMYMLTSTNLNKVLL